MGLFLPVLLLGLAQPADQPPSATSQPATLVQANVVSASSKAGSMSSDDRRFPQPFDRIEPYLDKPVISRERCLTIRSYYFERHDALAPEFKGMTTCEDARAVRDRNIKKGLKPRLVPATSGE